MKKRFDYGQTYILHRSIERGPPNWATAIYITGDENNYFEVLYCIYIITGDVTGGVNGGALLLYLITPKVFRVFFVF